jgi:murein L,D-transpeptidase YafK
LILVLIATLLMFFTEGLWAPAIAASQTPPATELLIARFKRAGVHYPPQRIQLIGLKETKRLELWAWEDRKWRHIHDYPIFAASGHAGPKLREGDEQVPEGFYRVEALNPNSQFHLSLKLDFPNPFDWMHAIREGRNSPGSNIFIHGSAWSKGCLAIGNRNIEEIYRLVSDIGMQRVQVLIAPHDLRHGTFQLEASDPAWVKQLYGYLRARMRQFPLNNKLYSCPAYCLVNEGWHDPVR